jgi:ElaB/YqjD/DUF883 family membrane-anchored ribosome-binding protein
MLNKEELRVKIEVALLDQRSNTDNPEAAAKDLSFKIADAIDDYVRDMTITYVSGLIAGPYPVTGSFSNTIS